MKIIWSMGVIGRIIIIAMDMTAVQNPVLIETRIRYAIS